VGLARLFVSSKAALSSGTGVSGKFGDLGRGIDVQTGRKRSVFVRIEGG